MHPYIETYILRSFQSFNFLCFFVVMGQSNSLIAKKNKKQKTNQGNWEAPHLINRTIKL
jgi:hypothetical protein